MKIKKGQKFVGIFGDSVILYKSIINQNSYEDDTYQFSVEVINIISSNFKTKPYNKGTIHYIREEYLYDINKKLEIFDKIFISF